MKLMYKRALSVLVLALLLVFGVFIFGFRYLSNGAFWVRYPVNQHLYKNGALLTAGTIFDRNGAVLAKTEDGMRVFHEDRFVRTAVMHAVGDLGGNISTGAQVVYGEKLSGWDFLNGVYRYDQTKTEAMDITLTLDAELCAVAYEALGWRKGAVGVYNYETGEILCMVSTPSYDPSNPPDVSSDPETYEGVYLNRFLSAAYTPGSIFKLVTAAAAINEIDDITSRVFHCDGSTIIGETSVTCPSAHGEVTFEEALADSCNVAFAHIAMELGGAALQRTADSTGVTAGIRFDGIRTTPGNVDCLNAEGADLAWAGIGQYTDTVNPLQFMTYVGAIANDGVSVLPKLVMRTGFMSQLISAVNEKRILSKSTAEKLGAMMRNNVLSNYGEMNFSGLQLCAKSGTGEVGGGEAPNAWFVGYLDREDCPLAFVVVIENGGSGSAVAAPVAASVLQAAVERMTDS
jgi:peptidoglycan glycosyltransferase